MQSNEQILEALKKEYEALSEKFINAVGDSTAKNELDHLKRKLEAVASQIRKLDVNRKL